MTLIYYIILKNQAFCYKIGAMKKIITRVTVLLVVFVAALMVFGLNTNQEGANLVSEMEAATFPVLSLHYRGAKVAQLFGNTTPMDMATMRDNLVVVRPDRDLTLEIQTFGRATESIRYEVRSLDGGHLYADGDLDFEPLVSDINRARIHLENILESEKEYQFVIIVKEAQQDIYFYTRLLQTENEHLDDYVDFVKNFHLKAFDSSRIDELSTYIEPNAYGNNNDFNETTINSTLKQIGYGGWNPTQLGSEELTVCEFNSQYAIFTVDYTLTYVAPEKEMEYYNAREYYRLGYNEIGERCYLYDFERNVSQIFREDGVSFDADSLILGIRDDKVEYGKSENGKITCFVQEGELWSVNETSHSFTRIFGFRGYEGIDIRENNVDHVIRIFSVEEGGSVSFAVYGYFPRGRHEGDTGISICRFDAVTTTVEELLYVESDKSSDRLIADIDGIIYEDNSGKVYFMNEGTLYAVNLADGESVAIATNMSTDRYKYDDINKVLSWQNEEGGDINVLLLYEGTERHILAGENESLSVIDYIDDDFIFGRTYDSTPAMETGVYPWNVIEIYSPATGITKKSYERDGYCISDIEVGDYTITMNRIKSVYNGSYKSATPDSIMNKEGEGIFDTNVNKTIDEIKQNLTTIKLSSDETDMSFEMITSRELINNQVTKIELDKLDTERFYIYAKGRCIKCLTNLSKAIVMADSYKGVVIDKNQKLIWSRAKNEVTNAISLELATLAGKDTPGSIIKYLNPQANAYELSGVTLNEVLYYVSEGIPVIVHSNNEDFLITGYDNNIVRAVHMDGRSGNQYTVSLEEELAKIGGKYTVYINN